MFITRVLISLLCCALSVTSNVLAKSEILASRLVNTTQGPVRGYQDFEGVYSFYGIPYATAPTGVNKFQAPLPPPIWSEPLEAVDKEIACPQIPQTLPYRIQEDCLVVNVFVPDTEETKLPVVIYIHGGGFQRYFGGLRTPINVVRSENVIVVTINYRLSMHGFLCLGTKAAPGNAGLKDQLAALKWVNRNIAAFGGDPNEVTIDGYSSGTACVDILALSPATVGLFNKVILGGILSLSNTIVKDPLKNAKIFASKLGFNNTENVFALEQFYVESSFYDLFDLKNAEHLELRKNITSYFSPCIERNDYEGVIRIITEPPMDIIKKRKYAKVPMLFAFSNMEGLLHLPFDAWKEEMNRCFYKFMPGSLEFANNNERDMVAHQIQSFYFKDKPISNDSILEYIDFLSDSIFKSPMLRTVSMHLEAGHDQIYLSEYKFVSEDEEIIPHVNIRGSGHSAAAYAVLDGTEAVPAVNETALSNDLKKMKVIMRKFWANFVKTGSPVVSGCELPPWPPVGPGLSPHMVLTLQPRLEHNGTTNL